MPVKSIPEPKFKIGDDVTVDQNSFIHYDAPNVTDLQISKVNCKAGSSSSPEREQHGFQRFVGGRVFIILHRAGMFLLSCLLTVS